MRRWVPILLLLIGGCQEKTPDQSALIKHEEGWKISLPLEYEQPSIPENNPMHPNKVALGKKLFFDRQLSRTHELSCGTCHQPAMAFTGGVPINPGVEDRIGRRNAPTLSNAAFLEAFMFDGGPRSLEAQAVLPFDDHNEFDLNLVQATERIRADKSYEGLFENSFGKPLEPRFIPMALAAYERTLISLNSPYDDYRSSEGNEGMSTEALRGWDLFTSERFHCNSCHVEPFFTNHSFQTNGAYEAGQDSGKMRVTLQESDRGLFKVPTLRNIALTAPYFHDGRFETLEEVLDFYATKAQIEPNSEERGLGFTAEEKKDLMAFLNALTDSSFVQRHLGDGQP